LNLRVPGPTPVPDDIRSASAQQMINHRGPEFAELITRIHNGMQQVFQTKQDVSILTASGTGAMEAAIVNSFSPGDKVLSISIGVFGKRFAQIAEAYGAEVIKPSISSGSAADPEDIKNELKKDPAIKGVLVTHNETSTGVTNDMKSIAKVVKSFDKLLLVDAISSLGCIPLPTDEWNCDIVISGSQKGFMVPPGLAFGVQSSDAIEASKKATMPRFYFDFEKHTSYYHKGQTPWTPAVSLFYGLDLALKKMLDEGLDQIFVRHKKIASKVRNAVKEIGLELFAKDEQFASDTVTSVIIPKNVDAKQLLGLLRTEHNVILAGGQGDLEGKIFRIGHLGYVDENEIDEVIEKLKIILPKVGF
jgi:aspartate aminotransferase-like enzyme